MGNVHEELLRFLIHRKNLELKVIVPMWFAIKHEKYQLPPMKSYLLNEMDPLFTVCLKDAIKTYDEF